MKHSRFRHRRSAPLLRNGSHYLPSKENDTFFSRFTVIGQLNAAYILCQDLADLIIIDQHAAHERVAFERLKDEFATAGIESQGLLFPSRSNCPLPRGQSLPGITGNWNASGFG